MNFGCPTFGFEFISNWWIFREMIMAKGTLEPEIFPFNNYLTYLPLQTKISPFNI